MVSLIKQLTHHSTWPDVFAATHDYRAKAARKCYVMERFIGTIATITHYLMLWVGGRHSVNIEFAVRNRAENLY